MDLKRLGHLVALVEECHFARAAERVHLSQPAFSRSIQSLEADVGMRLFDRDTSSVQPTPAGRFLHERARQLLFDARNLKRDAQLYRDSHLGDTAFGLGPFPAATLLPSAAVAMRQQHPEVGLRIEVNNWHLLLERLLREDIEFFIADTRDLGPDRRLAVEPLVQQIAHFYARPDHPLAGQPCTCAQVWTYGLAATKLPRPVRTLLARLVGLPQGEDLSFAIECDDIALLRAVAQSTDTVVALTDASVLAEVGAGRLVPLNVSDLPAVYADMGVVTLVGRTPSPAAQRAMACIRAVAQPAEVPKSRSSRSR